MQRAVDRQAGRAGPFRYGRVPGFESGPPARLELRQIGSHHAVCDGHGPSNRPASHPAQGV